MRKFNFKIRIMFGFKFPSSGSVIFRPHSVQFCAILCNSVQCVCSVCNHRHSFVCLSMVQQAGILYALTQNSGLIFSQNGKITNFGGIFSHFPLKNVYQTVCNLIWIGQRFLKSLGRLNQLTNKIYFRWRNKEISVLKSI